MKFKQILIVGVSAIGATLLVAATIYGANHFAKKQIATKTESNSCEARKGTSHTVTIENDKVSPQNTVANQCDTLTITNNDQSREIAFGQHDRHVAYDGITETTVKNGQSITVTLAQTGSFLFHDHDQEEVQGTFTVTKN